MPGDVETQNQNPLRTKSPPFFPMSTDGYGWNLLKSFRSLRLPEDGEGNAWALPVIITDPTMTRPHYPNEVFNNITGVFDFQKTPTIWKYNNLTNDGDIWTPATGKKFRLMGGIITIAGAALAVAAINTLDILDEAAIIMRLQIWCPLAAAATDTIIIPFSFPGNGYLSAAINQDLKLDINAPITQGSIAFNVWGCEE